MSSSQGQPADPLGSAVDSIDAKGLEAITRLTGFELPPHMTEKEFRTKAKSHAKSIFEAHDTIRAILARHSGLIQNRWCKKKKAQKIAILEHAWPGMAKTHRPDLALWRRRFLTKRVGQYTEDETKCFKCPYINHEDLVKPRTMMLLLHERGSHFPGEFAGADYEASRFGRISQCMLLSGLDSHTMILNGANTAEQYGNLLSWAEKDEYYEWYIERIQYTPSEGLFILDVQKLVMQFLVRFCYKILHDIPKDVLLTDNYPEAALAPLKEERQAGEFDSMAVMTLEASYRLPSKLDIDQIVALLHAKMTDALDHIWQLREDPEYFFVHLQETREHRQTKVKDTNGHEHPANSPKMQTLNNIAVLRELLVNACVDYQTFSTIHSQALCVQKLLSAFENDISPLKPLPEELLKALAQLRHHFYEGGQCNLIYLKGRVTASKPMRQYYERTSPLGAPKIEIKLRSGSGVNMTKQEEELVLLFESIRKYDEDVFMMRMPFIIDEIERLSDADRDVKELISPHIEFLISNISMISQCIRQLDLYQPWARKLDSVLDENQEEFMSEYHDAVGSWKSVALALDETSKHLLSAAELCKNDRNFTYPSNRRRTKETTEAMIAAEKNLDTVWAHIDRLIEEDVNDPAAKEVLACTRQIQRTKEWVEPIRIPKRQRKAVAIDADSVYRPLSNLYLDHNPESSTAATERSEKTKEKTKGQPSETPAPDQIEDPNPDDEDAEVEKIQVNARALKVFRALFFDPSGTTTPGEIS
ncbi:unnamed protein product [Clonostachys rosea]|uniref:Uncharacterized protein n=1 Tax=Bionectria ochroleuca TaxID=29856 RepID=A0ABY6UZR6_BIOOC|nr:unnamed protein product [Clonostachys rosea]